MLTKEDKELLAKKGIPEEKIAEQLFYFEKGFPYLKLKAPASAGMGIQIPDVQERENYLAVWDNYIKGDYTIVKFVPASGAASRMFKNLFEFLEADYSVPATSSEKEFFDRILDFAFYTDLNKMCLQFADADVPSLLKAGKYKDVVGCLLNSDRLNYGSLPKGVLKFHTYKGDSRTPLEEHLVEGALYAAGKNGKVNVHFTVSTEHKEIFKELADRKKEEYGLKYNTEFAISFSEQKPATDTVAADMDNKPFREDGRMVFRPGGHGALIENLNDLDADILFIKNIDNVVPDRLKEDTVVYKKLIAGMLVSLQKKIFAYLELLDKGDYSENQLVEIGRFLEEELCCHHPELYRLEAEQKVGYFREKLNRPIRVCGMVKNVGEPGGGPFWAYNLDGTISLQILESSQIDMNNPEKKQMFESGTYFNPVDLVCAVKDYKGHKFDLTRYVDKQTGFISFKSKNGRELKALELPGLWNGAMSNWNTVFVEVPLNTFNPVKTVNDLLRPQHQ